MRGGAAGRWLPLAPTCCVQDLGGRWLHCQPRGPHPTTSRVTPPQGIEGACARPRPPPPQPPPTHTPAVQHLRVLLALVPLGLQVRPQRLQVIAAGGAPDGDAAGGGGRLGHLLHHRGAHLRRSAFGAVDGRWAGGWVRVGGRAGGAGGRGEGLGGDCTQRACAPLRTRQPLCLWLAPWTGGKDCKPPAASPSWLPCPTSVPPNRHAIPQRHQRHHTRAYPTLLIQPQHQTLTQDPPHHAPTDPHPTLPPRLVTALRPQPPFFGLLFFVPQLATTHLHLMACCPSPRLTSS